MYKIILGHLISRFAQLDSYNLTFKSHLHHLTSDDCSFKLVWQYGIREITDGKNTVNMLFFVNFVLCEPHQEFELWDEIRIHNMNV